MNLKLNIEEDAELRAYIKDLIKGQVLSLVREEVLAVFKAELERKVKGMDTPSYARIMKEAMIYASKELLQKEMAGRNVRSEFINPVVTAKIDQAIASKDWDKLVDDLSTQKIQKLLKS